MNSDPPSPSEPSPDGPQRRRPRYSGKHPRRFDQKYKEHAAAAHPETVAKVLASGKTPAGSHVPVLVDEVLEALSPQAGASGVDCTLGHGGHARLLLEKLGATGWLLGLDVDAIQRPRTEAALRAEGFGPECFVSRAGNFAGLARVLADLGRPQVDFIFADLGCSSMQLDDPARGFTFREDGPLDMRLNPERGITAARWIEKASPAKLARALEENADDPRAEEMAAALAGKHFASTHDLVRAAKRVLPTELDPDETRLALRRVFQAVRIEVNEEFSALESFLRQIPDCLRAGGVAVVISFHSGEDRRVKRAFKDGLREGAYAEIAPGPVTASPAERARNPRSVPAKLRWARRAGD